MPGVKPQICRIGFHLPTPPAWYFCSISPRGPVHPAVLSIQETVGSILTQVGDPMFQPDSDLVGSGGKITFRFIASAPGWTTLKLVYQRWWEKGVPPLDEFEVNDRVKQTQG
ncbi:MAG: protease inhibitor I42 family protein [Bacillota bacterium]